MEAIKAAIKVAMEAMVEVVQLAVYVPFVPCNVYCTLFRLFAVNY